MILRAVIGTSILILCILCIRKMFGEKMNPNMRYIFWIFVAARILIPVSYQHEVTSITWLNTLSPLNYIYPTEGNVHDTDYAAGQHTNIIEYGTYEKGMVPASGSINNFSKTIFFIIWITGVICASIYVIVNNLLVSKRIKRRRKRAGITKTGIPIYELEGYSCLFGIFHPYICIDAKIGENILLKDHVISHEEQHYLVKDHIWVFVRTLCIILQWFNPLVWIAYLMSGNDCELACDYRVVKGMSDKERYQYGESLLAIVSLSIQVQKDSYLTIPMSKEGKTMGKRLEGIAGANRKKIYILPCLIVLLAVAVVFIKFIPSPKATNDSNGSGQKNITGTDLAQVPEEDTQKEPDNTQIPEETIEIMLLINGFAEAYLSGDEQGVKAFLSLNEEVPVRTHNENIFDQLDVFNIKGNLDNLSERDEVEVQCEHKTADEDSYNYLGIIMVREEHGWAVIDYYLEK